MRSCPFVTAFLLVSLLFATCLSAADFSSDLPDGSRLLAVVTFPGHSTHLSGAAKRKLDNVVAELPGLEKECLVRIEGHASGAASKREYIDKSFKLAAEVERYLRIERKVGLDLYIGALNDKLSSRSGRFVRVVAYPNRFREQWGITQKVTAGQ